MAWGPRTYLAPAPVEYYPSLGYHTSRHRSRSYVAPYNYNPPVPVFRDPSPPRPRRTSSSQVEIRQPEAMRAEAMDNARLDRRERIYEVQSSNMPRAMHKGIQHGDDSDGW
jgi:hypothetical protein